MQSVLWRAVGSIPGPLLYGVIFDTSCIYWQEECGRRGNCWVYNNNSISVRAFFLSLFGVAANTVFMILCWIFFPPVTCKKQQNSSSNQENPGPSGEGVNQLEFNPVCDADTKNDDTKLAESSSK